MKSGRQVAGSATSRISSYQAASWSYASKRRDCIDEQDEGVKLMITILDRNVAPVF